MVSLGEFDGAGWVGIENRCDQAERFGIPVRVCMALDLVLDHADRDVRGQPQVPVDRRQRDARGTGAGGCGAYRGEVGTVAKLLDRLELDRRPGTPEQRGAGGQELTP